MLLKKLYLYKNRIWLRRVENKSCYDLCDFYGHPREYEVGGCMSGVCLDMIRKLQNKIRGVVSYRYIPIQRYFEEYYEKYKQANATKEI